MNWKECGSRHILIWGPDAQFAWSDWRNPRIPISGKPTLPWGLKQVPPCDWAKQFDRFLPKGMRLRCLTVGFLPMRPRFNTRVVSVGCVVEKCHKNSFPWGLKLSPVNYEPPTLNPHVTRGLYRRSVWGHSTKGLGLTWHTTYKTTRGELCLSINITR